MAVSYVWPGSLPQSVRTDYVESRGERLLRTPMSAGVPKQRYVSRRPEPMTCSMLITSAQVETLEAFVHDTLKGVARFGFPHPRTREQIEARFVPTDDGNLYDIAYAGPKRWLVSFTLEVLP